MFDLVPPPPRHGRAEEPSFRDAMEGKARYAEMAAQKESRARRSCDMALAVALAIVAGWYFLDLPALWGAAFLAALMVVLAIEATRPRWSAAEYYALPATRNAAGTHRCVHCGHHAISYFRESGTRVQHAHCEQCDATLFTRRMPKRKRERAHGVKDSSQASG